VDAAEILYKDLPTKLLNDHYEVAEKLANYQGSQEWITNEKSVMITILLKGFYWQAASFLI
jgi:hypothetical protein